MTVTGRGFVNLPTLACRFGSVLTPGNFVSSGRILCRTPARSEPGTAQLEVTLNGVDFSAEGLKFSFLPTPSVIGLEPGGGSVAGGTKITVRGSHFAALGRDGTRVRCGWEMTNSSSSPTTDVLQTRAIVASDSSLTCSSPPRGEAGTIRVWVFADDVPIAGSESPLRFRYILPAKTLAVRPAHGRASGGTRIRVLGDNFIPTGETVCRFRSAPLVTTKMEHEETAVKVVDVRADFLSPGEVQCVSPAQEDLMPDSMPNEKDSLGGGEVLVEVSNPGFAQEPPDPNKAVSFWYRQDLKVRERQCPRILTEFALASH